MYDSNMVTKFPLQRVNLLSIFSLTIPAKDLAFAEGECAGLWPAMVVALVSTRHIVSCVSWFK